MHREFVLKLQGLLIYMDTKKIEKGVRLIIEGIGEDPDRPGSRTRQNASPSCMVRYSQALLPIPNSCLSRWLVKTTMRW